MLLVDARGLPVASQPYPHFIDATRERGVWWPVLCVAFASLRLCKIEPALPGDPLTPVTLGNSGRPSATQVDSATGNTESRDRFSHGAGWPTSMVGETILEAGCRFTEIMLGTGARLISFDYSAASDVTHDSFAAKGANVCQASIYDMPYRRESFDRVFCYGVIQQTPDVKKSFLALVDMVKPGGHIAVDVYDAWKWIFHSRYRVRWFTKRMNQEKLLEWRRKVVPAYMKIMPPLHPYNQIFVPIKDYRGARPGFTDEHLVEYSILDTFDMLAPEYDQPKSRGAMKRWRQEAGLVDIHIQVGGNGLEIRARKPAAVDAAKAEPGRAAITATA
jgi:2-polyprenyl-3-methyl-5-hydroxy-6-metoxy-1,4-benzoquinol methylase